MYAFHKESLKLHGKFHDYINRRLFPLKVESFFDFNLKSD